jgi:hypothetical protein
MSLYTSVVTRRLEPTLCPDYFRRTACIPIRHFTRRHGGAVRQMLFNSTTLEQAINQWPSRFVENPKNNLTTPMSQYEYCLFILLFESLEFCEHGRINVFS